MTKSRGKALRILIADDDKDDRFFAALAFKEASLEHTVQFVTDGEELMAYLKKLHREQNDAFPDLILLDLNMPKKDGRVALKEIKSDVRFQHLNVVIFSTHISPEDKRYTTALGALQHIIKPFDINELVDQIKYICNSYNAARTRV